jgi:hypothetical protein
MDRKTMRTYRATVNDLLADLDQARDDGDPDRVAGLEEQVARITSELKRGEGFGGRLKVFASMHTRQREAAYRSLHRTIQMLERTHPALGAHVRQAIVWDGRVAYRPEPTVHWQIQLPNNPRRRHAS